MSQSFDRTVLVKTISVVCFLTGGVGLVFSLNALPRQLEAFARTPVLFNAFMTGLMLAITCVGIVSGIFIWQRRLWALRLAILYFVVQVLGIRTATYFVYLYSGFQLFVSFNFGRFAIALNLFAFTMAILTIVANARVAVRRA